MAFMGAPSYSMGSAGVNPLKPKKQQGGDAVDQIGNQDPVGGAGSNYGGVPSGANAQGGVPAGIGTKSSPMEDWKAQQDSGQFAPPMHSSLGANTVGVQKGAGKEKAQEGMQGIPSTAVQPEIPAADIEKQTFDPLKAQYADILAQHEAGLQGELNAADYAAAQHARRAGEMGAIGGGQFGGGGFQAGLAQQGLYGQQMRSEAAREHAKRGIELRLGWLQSQIDRAEAEENRDLQKTLQEMMGQTQLELAALEAQANAPLSGAGGSSSGGESGGGVSGGKGAVAGAATGAAVGGPWGAVLGGGIGYVGGGLSSGNWGW